MLDYDKLLPIQEWAESGGNPNAVSSKGAIGPMQTMRPTLAKPGYSVRPAENDSPEETRRVGQDYSRAMGKEYGEALPDMLAAYNWGPGNFNKWRDSGRDPAKMPKETKDYIAKISAKYYGEAGAPTVEAGAGRGVVNPPSVPTGPVLLRDTRADREAMFDASFRSMLVKPTSPEAYTATVTQGQANMTAQVEARPSLLEMTGAALAGNTGNSIFKAIFRDRFEPVAGFQPDYSLLPKGWDSQLAEQYHDAKSPAEAQYAISQWAEEQFRIKTVGDRGAAVAVGLSFGAEIADPINWVVPFAAAKGLARLGMGSEVLFKAGATGAGYASSIGENLVSGTVLEAVKQSLQGEFKPVDLAVSVLADATIGGFTGMLSARGMASNLAAKAGATALSREIDLAARAEQRLGKLATPEEVRAEMEIIRKADANAVITDALADVPESEKLLRALPEDSLVSAKTMGGPSQPLASGPERKVVATAPVKESLENALNSPALSPAALLSADGPDSRGARQLINHLLTILPEGVLKQDVNFVGYGARGSFNPITDVLDTPGRGATDLMPSNGKVPNEAVILAHEVVHAATAKMIDAVEMGLAGVTKDMHKAVSNLAAIRRDLEAELRKLGKLDKSSEFGANYATKNLHEFVAQVMSDADTRGILAAMPAKGFVDRLTEFANAVMRLLGFNPKAGNTALQEAVTLIEKVIKEGPPPVERVTVTRTGLRGPQPDEPIRQAVINNPDTSLRAPVDSAVASKWQSAHDIVRHYLDVPEHAEVANLVVTSAHLRDIPVVHVKAGDNLPALVASSFNNGAAAAAVVDGKGAKIYIRGDFPEGYQLDIPLHEVVHAVTMAAVKRNPAIETQLAAWAKQAINHLDSIAFSGTRAKEDKAALDFFARVLRTAPADELLAYGTTSPTLRKVLSGMTEAGLTPKQDAIAGGVSRVSPTEPARPYLQNVPEVSLWDKFVDILRGVFGKPTKQGEVDKLAAEVEAVQAKYKQDLTDYNSFKMLTPKLLQYLDRLVADSNLHGVQGNVPSSRYAASSVDEADSVGPSDVVDELLQDPDYVKYGLTGLPVGTAAQRKEAQAILAIHKKAAAWEVANPMDDAWKARAKNLADNSVFNVASTGLLMLTSPSPVVRMIANQLLEDASGIAGKRKDTASIKKHIVERMMKGNAEVDVQAAYAFWKKGKPGGIKDDLVGGVRWATFNKEIAAEIEARKVSGGPVTQDPNVKAAADSVEAAYQRSANEMRRVNTIGSEGLSLSSVGYMPHRMNAKMFITLSNEHQQVVQSALTDQFVGVGWDISFSDQLAAKYLDLARSRASGDYGSAIGGSGASSHVEEALRAMQLPEKTIVEHMEKFQKGAANFTKKRLDLDLNKKYTVNGEDFKLLDIFETDQIELLRSHVGRASGEVALTAYGVRGKPGIDLLAKAMQYGENGKRADLNRDVPSFEQVMAEFMNEPYGKETGKWLNRAMQANTLVRLGSIVFNQFAESINGIASLGFLRAAETVTSIPRLRAEIHALARGEKVDNGLLSSIEIAGGAEFGTDSYKFVMPFDSPDHAYPTYGKDTLTLTDRLLRGGGHLQAKLSGWRTIHSAQQRGMAEQIVHKMARYVREGRDDIALDQFGITSEVRTALRGELSKIATFDGDRLVRFDVTKISDPAIREQVIQAVWRGTSQIIQGTFIGERGKWAHDGVLKLMTQFRTFQITSMEKQWGRQRNSHGSFKALGMLMGAMTFAAPIYMARTYLSSIGRDDQEKFLEERLQPQMIARATLNYVASGGMGGDFVDAITSTLPEDWGVKSTGGRSGVETDFVGNYIAPASSLVNDIWKYAQSPLELDDALKVMPGSRLLYLVPLVNLTKD